MLLDFLTIVSDEDPPVPPDDVPEDESPDGVPEDDESPDDVPEDDESPDDVPEEDEPPDDEPLLELDTLYGKTIGP